MAVHLNHTIVAARDKEESARFLAEILGLSEPQVGHFAAVDVDNGVSLDYANARGDITPQHYAFLIDEDDFDDVFGRIQKRQLQYWADPYQQQSGEINHRAGGRGLYFEDPNGHLLEVLTRV